jgi:hypothetical protein
MKQPLPISLHRWFGVPPSGNRNEPEPVEPGITNGSWCPGAFRETWKLSMNPVECNSAPRKSVVHATVSSVLIWVAIALIPLWLTACGKTAFPPSVEVATLGKFEVTARLTQILGEFPPNKLYDYVYVMKYQVVQAHRGRIEEREIFVGHYNPLKPRPTAADKFSGKVGGNVDRFQVGDVHRLALDAPLDQLYMGGVIDKHFKEPGVRYWAIWTERANE